ncbi:MAG: hypothetical protein VB876_08915, partial [Pirellulales bacterium]
GQGQGQGQGKGGQGKGLPPDLAESFAAGTSSTVARGQKVAKGRQASGVLSMRGRSRAIQNYVKQLPPEFRRQVAEYYEALAE